MESDQVTAAAALDELRRSQITPFTRYPKLGAWYPPACGALAGLWVTFLGLGRLWFLLGGTVIDLIAVSGSIAYTRRRGANPKLQDAPREIRTAMAWFFLGLAAAVGLVALTYHVVSWPAAAVVAFVAFTALIAVYERVYARAAERAERASGLFDTASS